MRLRQVRVIIWDPVDDAIVVDASGEECVLPVIKVDDAGFGASLPGAIWTSFRLETTLLENLGIADFVVELRGDARLRIPGFDWCAVKDLDRLGVEAHLVSRWLIARDAPLRPWFEAGWLDRAQAYIDGALIDLKKARTDSIQQVKHWAVSSVIRVPTVEGPVYFKAAPPHVRVEPQLLSALATRWPESIPTLLAWSRAENWWITEDFGTADGWTMTGDECRTAIEVMAEMQIEITGNPGLIAGVDCSVTGPMDLASAVPALLDRDDLWRAQPDESQHWRPLDDEQRSAWLQLGPWLMDRCAQLADRMNHSGITPTLIHGDFHLGNIARRGTMPLIHDWSSAEIAHPFFDLAMLLDSIDDASAPACLEAYFSRWARAGFQDDLDEHWRLAKPISALFETLRAVALVDDFGGHHWFSMIAVVYGWVRRLLGSVADESARVTTWSSTGIASKR